MGHGDAFDHLLDNIIYNIDGQYFKKRVCFRQADRQIDWQRDRQTEG